MPSKRSPAVGPAPSGGQGTLAQIQGEIYQNHGTRAAIYKRIKNAIGRDYCVVSLFTSFYWPVSLSDPDADMLEEVLRNSIKPGERLALILNSPGGDALAAERIINICRSHSPRGFIAIVPKMAKSAATMICLGAKEIWMSQTSELGPIDPQIPIMVPGRSRPRFFAAHEILNSYNDLMRKANRTKGRIEPYLQQLSRFDARDIQWIISAQQLSESIAVRTLQSGVMKGRRPTQIRNKMRPLLDPDYAKVHGRPLYHDVAKKCGLAVKLQPLHSPLWEAVWELYVRLNNLTSFPMFGTAKVVESAETLYSASIGTSINEGASSDGQEASA